MKEFNILFQNHKYSIEDQQILINFASNLCNNLRSLNEGQQDKLDFIEKNGFLMIENLLELHTDNYNLTYGKTTSTSGADIDENNKIDLEKDIEIAVLSLFQVIESYSSDKDLLYNYTSKKMLCFHGMDKDFDDNMKISIFLLYIYSNYSIKQTSLLIDHLNILNNLIELSLNRSFEIIESQT
jgi:hypothetical protein